MARGSPFWVGCVQKRCFSRDMKNGERGAARRVFQVEEPIGEEESSRLVPRMRRDRAAEHGGGEGALGGLVGHLRRSTL